ncbi:MAG: hypothetical protein MUE62_10355 [Burkholderiaceae bacterium]|jgi:hypothetical protein|nr:hypothetical protein [Burkholderiaceae bacterium]
MDIRPQASWRRRLAGAATAFALASCGGGEIVALLPFVTPVGGAWNFDADPATPSIDNVPGEFFNVSPVAGTPYLLASPIAVAGTYAALDPSRRCIGQDSVEVAGTIDDGALVLHVAGRPDQVCVRGRFADLATFRADDGRVYRNRRVDVQLDVGVWVDVDRRERRFKFTVPDSVNNVTGAAPSADDGSLVAIAGCELTVGAKPAITGQLAGYVQATGAPPSIAALLRDGQPLFTQGVVVDGATIEFAGPQGKVKLRREADTAASCT